LKLKSNSVFIWCLSANVVYTYTRVCPYVRKKSLSQILQ
jgi:hypothetical protein